MRICRNLWAGARGVPKSHGSLVPRVISRGDYFAGRRDESVKPNCRYQDNPIIAYIDFMLISTNGHRNFPMSPLSSRPTRMNMP